MPAALTVVDDTAGAVDSPTAATELPAATAVDDATATTSAGAGGADIDTEATGVTAPPSDGEDSAVDVAG